jgi:hypothetical protein
MAVYTQHLSDTPEEMVYRSDWVSQLRNADDPCHVPALLDMLDQESDAGIRGLIASAIGGFHTTKALADAEYVIRRLEEHLETEENIRWARPSVQLTIGLLHLDPADFEEEPDE